MNEMGIPEFDSPSDADLKLLSSREGPYDATNMSNRFAIFCRYVKSCKNVIASYGKVLQYCQVVGIFRGNVLNSENLAKKLRDLQQEVCKKFDGFPKVGFCAPVSDSSLRFTGGNDGYVVVDSIRTEIGKIRKSAQNKLSCQIVDFAVELNQLVQLWDQHKGYLDACKKQLSTACESWNAVMIPLRTDVEVMIRLSRYVDVLEKALQTTDVTPIYLDLFPLVKCDYLRMTESEMKLLEKAVGVQQSAVPAAASAPNSGNAPKSDMEEYIDTLNEQLRLLRESYNRLKRESDILRQQNEQIAATARKAFNAYSTMIADLRAQLKEHGIPDPTVDDS